MGMCGCGLLKLTVTSLVLYRQPKESTTIHFHMFVMELLQWQNVYKNGEDEDLRPPVVALSTHEAVCLNSFTGHSTITVIIYI